MMGELLDWFRNRKKWIDAQYETSDITDVSDIDALPAYSIYTINGTYIGNGDIHTLNLPRGIYIVNKKKYIVK